MESAAPVGQTLSRTTAGHASQISRQKKAARERERERDEAQGWDGDGVVHPIREPSISWWLASNSSPGATPVELSCTCSGASLRAPRTLLPSVGEQTLAEEYAGPYRRPA